MTKEHAILVLDSLATWLGYERPITEEIVEAIKTLHKYSLPSNLDEAVEDCIQGLIPEAELPATTPFALEYVIEMLYKTFKAGAEWMAGQGVAKEAVIGMATEEISINVSEQTLNELELCPGDKVVVQIRKK